MKVGPALCAAFTLFGCSSCGSTPTAPMPPVEGASAAPTPSASTISLWGFVVEPSGACVEDAIVEVVRGSAQGQRVAQETPCDAWSYGNGFVFRDLTSGGEMTLRASAPGWSTEEQQVVPGNSTAVVIELKKIPH